mmetsp:Transcript_148850/g.414727  ORF Transcript_148850/g.414727 Transcript_148850/m.414727 type:complete len:479 (+) Transcript_148850:459-1895(+)
MATTGVDAGASPPLLLSPMLPVPAAILALPLSMAATSEAVTTTTSVTRVSPLAETAACTSPALSQPPATPGPVSAAGGAAGRDDQKPSSERVGMESLSTCCDGSTSDLGCPPAAGGGGLGDVSDSEPDPDSDSDSSSETSAAIAVVAAAMGARRMAAAAAAAAARCGEGIPWFCPAATELGCSIGEEDEDEEVSLSLSLSGSDAGCTAAVTAAPKGTTKVPAMPVSAECAGGCFAFTWEPRVPASPSEEYSVDAEFSENSSPMKGQPLLPSAPQPAAMVPVLTSLALVPLVGLLAASVAGGAFAAGSTAFTSGCAFSDIGPAAFTDSGDLSGGEPTAVAGCGGTQNSADPACATTRWGILSCGCNSSAAAAFGGSAGIGHGAGPGWCCFAAAGGGGAEDFFAKPRVPPRGAAASATGATPAEGTPVGPPYEALLLAGAMPPLLAETWGMASATPCSPVRGKVLPSARARLTTAGCAVP